MPRGLKYVWALVMTFLLSASFAVEGHSEWLPVLHRAIDVLQHLAPITPSRSDTNQYGAPPPPSEAGS